MFDRYRKLVQDYEKLYIEEATREREREKEKYTYFDAKEIKSILYLKYRHMLVDFEMLAVDQN